MRWEKARQIRTALLPSLNWLWTAGLLHGAIGSPTPELGWLAFMFCLLAGSLLV